MKCRTGHTGPDHSEPAEPNQCLHCQIAMCKHTRKQSTTKVKWYNLLFFLWLSIV